MAMSKLMLVIILSLSLIDAVAQTKGNKRQAVAFTVEELLDAYKFEEASAQIQKELYSRKSVETELLNEQLAIAKMGQNMLSCVENVVVLDSIVVDKEKLLSVYRIGTEAGKIHQQFSLYNEKASARAWQHRLHTADIRQGIL